MTREVWMPVLGYEGYYEASNLGNVRKDIASSNRSLGIAGKILKPSANKFGYQHISLSKNGVVKTHRVAKVILSAFCGDKPFEKAHVAHNDGNPSNNKLTNLRWATALENQYDVLRHGNRCNGEDVFGAKLKADDIIRIRQRILNGERNKPIAEDFGVSISTIHLIRHNRIWRHVK